MRPFRKRPFHGTINKPITWHRLFTNIHKRIIVRTSFDPIIVRWQVLRTASDRLRLSLWYFPVLFSSVLKLLSWLTKLQFQLLYSSIPLLARLLETLYLCFVLEWCFSLSRWGWGAFFFTCRTFQLLLFSLWQQQSRETKTFDISPTISILQRKPRVLFWALSEWEWSDWWEFDTMQKRLF